MFRFAIWAAVSTEAQAASDKVSIQEQETKCRQVANDRGWRETTGPFLVPGESRSRWVNLRDAEQAIPALRTMLNAAQHHQFDLLVMYDYNRLRDLLDPVAKTLAFYNVQIFSVSQPVEPIAVADYNPYASDTANIMQGMSKIISQAQIADLRRKYKYAMPRRVSERGLPVQIPFGYRKPPGRETDRNAVPVQDPRRAGLVLKARDMLFRGQSIQQIVEMLEKSGEPPPRGARWYPQTVRDILKNPFYAGFVRWGVSAVHLDPRTGKRYRDREIPPEKIIIAKGKHVPLWDEETHRDIISEISSRRKNYRGKMNHQFTGLMVCGVCGQKLWTFYDGNFNRPEQNIHVWRCSSRKRHVVISNENALQEVAKALKSYFTNKGWLAQEESKILGVNKPVIDVTSQIEELQSRRKRLEDGYLAGLFSLQSFTSHVSDLDRQISALEQQVAGEMDIETERARRFKTLGELVELLEQFPNYLAEGDPQEINQKLRVIVDKIVVAENKDIKIQFK